MIFVPVPVLVVIWLWAYWLSGRYGCPRWTRRVPWIVTAAWGVIVVMTVIATLATFGAVSGESVDGSQKARLLGEAISEGMNVSVFAVVPVAIGAIVMLVLTAKYHWFARPPTLPPQPPYR